LQRQTFVPDASTSLRACLGEDLLEASPALLGKCPDDPHQRFIPAGKDSLADDRSDLFSGENLRLIEFHASDDCTLAQGIIQREREVRRERPPAYLAAGEICGVQAPAVCTGLEARRPLREPVFTGRTRTSSERGSHLADWAHFRSRRPGILAMAGPHLVF